MIEILVIDDHPLVSNGINLMLKDEAAYRITGNARSAKEAQDFLSGQKADLILLDINLPDTDGLQLCEWIRKRDKEVKIIGLTSVNDVSIITQLLHKGANGYLLKNMEREELLDAISKVFAGKIFLSKEANEKVLEQYSSVNSAVDAIPLLTRREKEILQLLNEGLNGPQIAEKLFLSSYTVETHRKNMMQKFHAGNLQQLLKQARDFKLIN